MEEEEKEFTIEERLIYNNNKLVADKIRKTLLNIRNVPGLSSKRWIWELIQNAKDARNNFGKVEIKIELNEDSLIFLHNASYFTIDNVLGILQQVSSKDSKNTDDQTGKFGTGFIGTHLLSSKVNIKGVVFYKNSYKRFKIFLDRTADSSEVLLKEVHNSIIKFLDNMNNNDSEYEPIKIYEQKQTDFDTSFEYLFDNDSQNSLKIAQEGLDDLINTAPATLSNQYKKISSITIIDNIKKKITKSSNTYEKLEDDDDKGAEIGLNKVLITEDDIEKKDELTINEKYLYSYKTKECRLLYQVEKKNETFEVVEKLEEQPIIYRDFPLIGSHKFHFPFFIDGFQFNPLETRNGLYLNGEVNKEATDNRFIIEKAIQNAINFTDWLLEQNINKRYLLAKTNIPEPPQRYDNIAINWFIGQQKIWRKNLLEKKLLKNKYGSYVVLKKLKMPIFKGKFNKRFFDLLSELNITEGIIPIKEEAKLWFDILENDPLKEVYDINENTWDFNYSFTEKNLVIKINDFGSLKNLESKMSTDSKTILDWLNKLYDFLMNNNCKNYLFQYNLIPNKKGQFKKINFGNI